MHNPVKSSVQLFLSTAYSRTLSDRRPNKCFKKTRKDRSTETHDLCLKMMDKVIYQNFGDCKNGTLGNDIYFKTFVEYNGIVLELKQSGRPLQTTIMVQRHS